MSEIILRKPCIEDEMALIEMRNELCTDQHKDSFAGSGSLRKYEDIKDWIAFLKEMECEETCRKDLVPSTQYIAVRVSDQRIVGLIDLRHHIDHDVLGVWGGHIGYIVRPSERGKGYAKEMLKQNLKNCKARNIQRVLVTCSSDNFASAKTILANGGVYECTVDVDGEQIQRYWIEL